MYYDSGDFESEEIEEGISSSHLPRPNKVKEKLFIGCQDSAHNLYNLKANKISHILDLTGSKPRFPNHFIYYTIEKLDDAPNQDLLSRLPECIKFIEEAIDQGTGILIHCAAGVSRSCSVVVAFLMRKENISVEDALEIVRTARPVVRPNCGFMKQLFMFQRMKYCLDGTTRDHRLYTLEKLSKKFKLYGEVPDIIPMEDPQTVLSSENQCYCCSSCQRELFFESNIIEHLKGIGPYGKNWCCQDLECETFYVEPIAWMGHLGKEGGELHCPKCGIHLGCWTWSETLCSCRSVVSPSFQIKRTHVVKEQEKRTCPNSFS